MRPLLLAASVLAVASLGTLVFAQVRPALPVPIPPVKPLPAKIDPCDRDGDGHRNPACGGDDCDDDDRLRYPGNPERCDGTLPDGRPAATHDEDCDPCTVAGAPLDGDGDADDVPGVQCTNPTIGGRDPVGCDPRRVRQIGAKVLGADCNDRNVAIVPGAQWCSSDTTVDYCLKGGPLGLVSGALPFAPTDFVPSNAIDVGAYRVKCPAGSKCLAQPNGTGICR